jgi:deferrochelatase/peroxidase EfeB
METNAQNQKLNKYEMENQTVYTGFSSFNDAEEHANKIGGTLVEVGFKDGNDNPQITDDAGLIEKKLHYYVDAGDEYKFIHSSDPGFRKYADELQKIKASKDKTSPEERYFANFEIENTEDPIIVIKNDQLESVTSRERSKYLKHAHVYEIGVARSKS